MCSDVLGIATINISISVLYFASKVVNEQLKGVVI